MSACPCGADHAIFKTDGDYGEWLCGECYEKWITEEIFESPTASELDDRMST